MAALLDHEDMTVINVGKVFPELGLGHNQLLEFLIRLVLNGEYSPDKYPVARSHWAAGSDGVEELIRDLDGAEVDALQEAEGLYLRLNVEADISNKGHGPRARVVSANKQILLIFLSLIHQLP